jgi:hypothetical protein
MTPKFIKCSNPVGSYPIIRADQIVSCYESYDAHPAPYYTPTIVFTLLSGQKETRWFYGSINPKAMDSTALRAEYDRMKSRCNSAFADVVKQLCP